MEHITRIPKFRRCVLQNFPFIEQDFDALTDYELLCKVVEYLNKVIDAQNKDTEDIADLQAAFNQLKSYVDNYFDNIDVQSEVDAKLDEMAEDGTLEEIIGHYIQDNFVTNTDYATDELGGVVKVGDTLNIDENGVLNANEHLDYIPAEFHVTRYQGTGGYSTVYYAFISKDYKPTLTLANNTVDTVELGCDNALANKATFAVNAGRFNTSTGETTGMIIKDGEILKAGSGGDGSTETLYMTEDGTIDSVIDTATAAQVQALGAVWAVSGWYPFIKNSVDLTGNRDPSDYQPRSILCQNAAGDYLIFSCMGRSYNETGMSAVDCKTFAASLGFTSVFMYNLDGGASVNFIEHGQRMNGLIDRTNRPVANFVSWISPTADDAGVYGATNTTAHKVIQNEKLQRPINIKSRIEFATNVSANLNTAVLSFGEFVIANIDINTSATISAYGRLAEGLPKNAVSDSHFIFRKTDGSTADAYIDNNGKLSLASGQSMSSGRWIGTMIYSTDAGLSQNYNPE